jgi:hypothetical protein
MKIGKVLLIVLALMALANPLLWRLLVPVVAVGLGLYTWYLVFKGFKAILTEKKTRE